MVDFILSEHFSNQKDKLSKKYETLDSDFERFIKVLNVDIKEGVSVNTNSKHIPKLSKKGVILPVYKAKKFYCKYLNSNSKIRVIYCYDETCNKVLLMEIYCKNRRTNHDEELIVNWLKGLNSLENY